MLCEQEIRELNSDFNYRHYGQFIENAQPEEGAEPVDPKPSDNLMQRLWNKVVFDPEAFRPHYEEWLEDEVWTYFD